MNSFFIAFAFIVRQKHHTATTRSEHLNWLHFGLPGGEIEITGHYYNPSSPLPHNLPSPLLENVQVITPKNLLKLQMLLSECS